MVGLPAQPLQHEGSDFRELACARAIPPPNYLQIRESLLCTTTLMVSLTAQPLQHEGSDSEELICTNSTQMPRLGRVRRAGL
eukprot:1159272-Pelagomonas_calceolata.AAC.1